MSKLTKAVGKRNSKGQFVHAHSKAFMAALWLASLISLVLLWLSARAVMSDFGSFRSCSASTGILTLSSCGKQSLNLGDFALLGLFALAVCFAFSLLTAAWRATRKGTIIT